MLRAWFQRQPESRRPVIIIALVVATWVLLGIPAMAALYIALRIWG